VSLIIIEKKATGSRFSPKKAKHVNFSFFFLLKHLFCTCELPNFATLGHWGLGVPQAKSQGILESVIRV